MLRSPSATNPYGLTVILCAWVFLGSFLALKTEIRYAVFLTLITTGALCAGHDCSSANQCTQCQLVQTCTQHYHLRCQRLRRLVHTVQMRPATANTELDFVPMLQRL